MSLLKIFHFTLNHGSDQQERFHTEWKQIKGTIKIPRIVPENIEILPHQLSVFRHR